MIFSGLEQIYKSDKKGKNIYDFKKSRWKDVEYTIMRYIRFCGESRLQIM